MSTQNIKLGQSSRDSLEKGIKQISQAVVSTLGPSGRNVIYFKDGVVTSTKDGVSVAKSINKLEDPVENLGMQMVKQASIKTSEKAGDGTTTATLLASEMVYAGLKHLNNGEKAIQIKREMDESVGKIIDFVKDAISEDISSEEQIKQIATVSSNNDTEIGELITTAIEKVGKDGVVHIEESKSGETYLETVEGIQFDRGYKSHYFVTNNETMSSVLNEPYILLVNHKLIQAKELLPILEAVSQKDRSLLIIPEDIDGEALATLIVNKGRGTIKVTAVKAPDFGDRRKLVLEDIAILTGGVVVDKDKGMKLEDFSWDWFGEARTVTISKEQTTIVAGKGTVDKINERVTELQKQIEASTTPFETEQLQNRLAKMVGGVSIIHVGGYTEAEMNEKKDRVDDALNATKAAIEEGVIPGGGVTLLYAREILSKDKETSLGAKIIYDACGKPFEHILLNCGYDEMVAGFEGIRLTESSSGNYWTGLDIDKGEVVNMKEFGIIDPFKVARVALQSAVSVAGTILLTEATVTDEPSDKEEINPMAGMF